MAPASVQEAAWAYAERGWPVLPLWWPGRKGACAAAGLRVGKHPVAALVPHGLHDASADPAQVERWWRIAPGQPGGAHGCGERAGGAGRGRPRRGPLAAGAGAGPRPLRRRLVADRHRLARLDGAPRRAGALLGGSAGAGAGRARGGGFVGRPALAARLGQALPLGAAGLRAAAGAGLAGGAGPARAGPDARRPRPMATAEPARRVEPMEVQR